MNINYTHILVYYITIQATIIISEITIEFRGCFYNVSNLVVGIKKIGVRRLTTREKKLI